MKYNARQLQNQNWAVFKNRSKFWPNTETEDRVIAERKAALFSASWHIEQAANLLSELSLEGAKELGREAHDIVDAVCNRNRAEDSNFDEMDPRGWLS